MIYNSGESWNRGAKYNTSIPTNFQAIKTVQDLILYLDDFSARSKNYQYVYHYTTLPNLIKIINGKQWHLANAKGMNDKLEYECGDSERWKSIFFASFMVESKESIGMWSMYSQPWNIGVKIAIPITVIKDWIKSSPSIYGLKLDSDKRYVPVELLTNTDGTNVPLKLSAVAYSNAYSLETPKESEILAWSSARNNHIKGAPSIPELTGYIKDKAWDYEKEIRLKAIIPSRYNFDRVAIEIPDKVILGTIITAGPLFEGTLEEKIKEEVEYQGKTESSIFTKRLSIKNICDNCHYKKKS